MSDLTAILEQIRAGDASAAGRLFTRVYSELRQIAGNQVKADGYSEALSPTELVHEAYVRLFKSEKPSFVDRNYFFATVAQAMRRVRVDHYRTVKSIKRGGKFQRVDLDSALAEDGSGEIDLVALDDALTLFEQRHPDKAKLVELRFFAGLTMSRVAEILGISLATAERQWKYAKAWLLAELRKEIE